MKISTALYISFTLHFARKIAGKILLPGDKRVRPYCIAAMFIAPGTVGPIAVPLFMLDEMPGPDKLSMVDLDAHLRHNGIHDHMPVPFTNGVEYLGTGPWIYQNIEPFIQKGNTTFLPGFVGTIRQCVLDTYNGILE